jgi:hypothetical protein
VYEDAYRLSHTLNDITRRDELRIAMLDSLLDLVGGNLVALSVIDASELRARVLHRPKEQSLKEPLSEAVTSTLARHPMVLYYQSNPRCRCPTAISDFLPNMAGWEASPVYQRVFAPLDGWDQLIIPVFPEGPVSGTVQAYSVNRSRTDRGFCDEDKQIAAMLQLVFIGQHGRHPRDDGVRISLKQAQALEAILQVGTQQAAARMLNISLTSLQKRVVGAARHLGTEHRDARDTAYRAKELGLLDLA